MRLALATPVPPGAAPPPLRQRATSLVLGAAATFLILLALWSLNVHPQERPRFKGTLVFNLKPDSDTTDTSKKEVQAKIQPREEQAQPNRPTPPPPRPSPLPVVHPYYIPLTREENDSADIGRMPHAGPRSGGAEASAGSPGDSRPIGNAPDGSPLYKAEWYRRPTNAELDFYLPKNTNVRGIGVIACKTIDHYHVDDCVELGSSPPGSHLARAVRQAAWQFLVRPPRRGGKSLVGTWVSIGIDYDVIVRKEEMPTDDTPRQPDNSTYIPY